MSREIELSIVIGSGQAWPELRLPLESLRPQLQGLDVEVIVGLATPQGMDPSYAETFPGLTVLCEPGASVFRLRSLGIAMARGAVIAITEDHCRVHPDWCQRLLAAHRAHPDFPMIGGSVDNGADRKVIDWANYLVANVRFMPPVDAGPCDSVSMQANLTLKQAARPPVESDLGNMEMLLVAKLAKSGQRFYIDPSIKVDHVQSHGFWRAFAVHFHNGRSIAGFRIEQIAPVERWLRLISTPLLPLWLVIRAWRYLLVKRRRLGWGLVSLPLMLGLGLCHAAGEAAGYLFGPGRSPAMMK